MAKYRLNKGCCFNIGYHIVWCTKYRRMVLKDDILNDFKTIILSKALENNLSIESIEIMDEHLHLFIKADPTISPHRIVKLLKGASSNFLRKKYPILLKMPCLWSNSYYVGTIGYISESVVKTYIEHQKGK